MKKFLFICKGLSLTKGLDGKHRLNYKNVNGLLNYLQYPVNKNRYFEVEILRPFKDQERPAAILEFNDFA